MTQSTPNPYTPPTAAVAEISGSADSVVTRRQLVPLWIKIFGWFFILMGAATSLMAVYAVAVGQPAPYGIFGLEYRGSVFHPMALIVLAIILSLAASAYGLLFGKPWGLNACLVTGHGGAAICLCTTVYAISQGSMNLHGELLFHIPYLVKLHRIKPLWRSAPAR